MSDEGPRPNADKAKQLAARAPARDSDESSPPRWVLPAIMIATLTIGGWYIIQNLADTSKMEDCTMSGRRNCVPPIDTSKMGQ